MAVRVMKHLFAHILALTAFVFCWPPGSGPSNAKAAERVDLELIMVADVSRSIDEDEARLQREGVAAAFLSADVIGAIRAGLRGRIAVAYIDYSSRPFNKVVVDWRIIHDQESANGFAQVLLKAPLTDGSRTSISDAIEHAVQMLEGNAITGTRRIIDVAGDGPNNHGRLVSQVRDETVAKGITINGLPIVEDPGLQFRSRYYLPDLDQYYLGCVIGGRGAFHVPARNFKDFARAIKKKLILEIANRVLDRRPIGHARVIKASGHGGAPGLTVPAGPGYRLGCDIGERMRNRAWGDPDDP
jgi:hypothetical protein